MRHALFAEGLDEESGEGEQPPHRGTQWQWHWDDVPIRGPTRGSMGGEEEVKTDAGEAKVSRDVRESGRGAVGRGGEIVWRFQKGRHGLCLDTLVDDLGVAGGGGAAAAGQRANTTQARNHGKALHTLVDTVLSTMSRQSVEEKRIG